MKKYGVKYRTIVDENMDIIKNVYSPVLYIDGEELFLSESKDGKILEFSNREDALLKAKEVYKIFKDNFR